MALLGILALSVTVTAVLLTASSEAALSSAHQDAARDVYVAQGGLEAYVAQMGMGLQPVENLRYLPPGGAAADEALINVRRIGTIPNADNVAWPDDLLFSVTAQPFRGGRGGRKVGAMARIATVNLTLRNNIKAAIVSGSNLTLGGNTTVSNRTDAALCADTSDYAIQIDSTNTIREHGNPNITGNEGYLGSNTDAYLRDMIGASLTDLKNNATIKFGRGQFNSNTQITSFRRGHTVNVANRVDHQATPYNWGCPADLLRHGSPNQNTWCESDLNAAGQIDYSDMAHMPIIAIDASKPNGDFGAVSMNLEHGQGMLVVYNGDLNIQGQLAFKGLIIVEGSFRIQGAGNNGARFEGSVIGLGKGGNNSEVEEDNQVGGTPTVRFNKCAIDLVLDLWNDVPRYTQVFPRTHSWFEVVR